MYSHSGKKQSTRKDFTIVCKQEKRRSVLYVVV